MLLRDKITRICNSDTVKTVTFARQHDKRITIICKHLYIDYSESSKLNMGVFFNLLTKKSTKMPINALAG